MQTKCFIGLIAMLFVNTMQGSDRSDFAKKFDPKGWYASVSVTSTNLVLEFPLDKARLLVVQKRGGARESHVSEHGEKLTLTPNCETVLTDGHHVAKYLIPVEYKNKLRGFKIIDEFDARSFGRDVMTNSIIYVALSDTPIEVGEEDVEAVIEWARRKDGSWYGEWKPYVPSHPTAEKDDVATPEEIPSVIEPTPSTIPPSHEELPPVTATETKSFNLWLYLGIGTLAFLLGGILWFVRKKT